MHVRLVLSWGGSIRIVTLHTLVHLRVSDVAYVHFSFCILFHINAYFVIKYVVLFINYTTVIN